MVFRSVRLFCETFCLRVSFSCESSVLRVGLFCEPGVRESCCFASRLFGESFFYESVPYPLVLPPADSGSSSEASYCSARQGGMRRARLTGGSSTTSISLTSPVSAPHTNISSSSDSLRIQRRVGHVKLLSKSYCRVQNGAHNSS
jgi:hypothetical protein